jgi:hypothetical protein
MSCAVRSAPDHQAFIALVDRYAAEFGLPTYSEIARALPLHVAAHEMAERNSADLYAVLRTIEGQVGELQVLLARTGLDQPRAVVELILEEALEKATAASMAAGVALFTTETRVDLDGRDDVTVLADARTQLRAAGRRL